MRQSDLKLDGNAIEGLLREIFTMEMTAAQTTCAGCGAVNAVGRVDVYMDAPGTVVRCPSCESVLMRIAELRAWVFLILLIVFFEGGPEPGTGGFELLSCVCARDCGTATKRTMRSLGQTRGITTSYVTTDRR